MDNIINYLKDHPETGRRTLAKKFNISESKARFIVKQFKQSILKDLDNDDLIQYTIDKELSNQKLRDDLRITKKVRDEYRVSNYLKELTTELINCYKDYKPQIIKHQAFNEDSVGIIHVSDWHLNEIISLSHNQYDFKIAAKRLQKLVQKSKVYFKANNIKNVLLAMTGDIFSAIKHTSQLINAATSRGQAVFVGAEICKQMIEDLNKDFNVSISCVAGNETRETSFQLVPSDQMLMSDNLDITLFSLLKMMFKDTEVRFLDTNIFDCIISIKDKNFLFIHGYNLGDSNLQKQIQGLVGKYARKGIRIDFCCFGHVHNPCISDSYARCGSLCGDNNYGHNTLDYCSKASQNIYIVSNNSIDGFAIDLQNTDNYSGYYVDEKMIYKQNLKTQNCNVVKL